MFKSFKARISITFFLTTALIAGFFFITLYTHRVKDHTQNLRLNLKNTAMLAAGFIRGEDVLRVSTASGCERDVDRNKLIQKLQKITKVDNRLDDAYVMIPSGQESTFTFVANADFEASPIQCGERYDASPYPEMMNAMITPGADQKVSSDKWGDWLSGYAPIYDSSGKAVAFLGLDIAEKTIQDLQRVFLERFAIVLLITLLLALLVGLLSSQWLTKPIDRIIVGMERVGEGDLNHQLKPLSQSEFNKIVDIFNKMTTSVKTMMSQLKETVTQKERLNKELELAADIQKRVLPDMIPPEGESLDIAAKSLPAKEVGGDYFDFLSKDLDKIGFAIADAAGKGFPGSLFMTNSRSVFRVVSSEQQLPSAVLTRTNDFISNDASKAKGMFITFLYSVYDKKSKKLTYSSAGHYPPLAFSIKDKKFKSVKVAGMPLGIYPGQDYPDETLQLESGDVVVMYTDGIIEAMNQKKEMFGQTQLMEIIEQNSTKSAAAIADKIENSIQGFIGQEPLFDDMTLVVFRTP